MPFAGYKNFDACVKANSDKDDPKAYCAELERKAKKEEKSNFLTFLDISGRRR